MRDFELNRNIDAVQVMSKNQPKPGKKYIIKR